jgi:hypothetical protein
LVVPSHLHLFAAQAKFGLFLMSVLPWN